MITAARYRAWRSIGEDCHRSSGEPRRPQRDRAAAVGMGLSGGIGYRDHLRVNRVGRALKVRQGEGRTVVLGTAVMLVAEAGGAFGQSGVDALFFARSGTGRLAEAIVVSGVLMFVAAIGVTALLGRVARRRLFLTLPLVAAAVLVVERAIAAAGPTWIYPGIWLTGAVVLLVQGLSTWGLVGIVVDARQAKRLFPLFGAGRILGAVAGGLLTRPLAGLIGAENLLLVWAAGLIAATVAGRRLVGRPAPRAMAVAKRRRNGPLEEMREGFRFVRRSPLMRWMALAAVLFSVLFYLLYLPFSAAATTQFPDADALAGFLGLLWAATAGGGFLVSLLLSNRLLARFGVAAMITVLPLIYLAGFGILIGGAAFATLVSIRVVQMVFLSGVALPAWEAVINVVPAARRDQTRAFLNGAASQAGTVVGGLIQTVAVPGLNSRILYTVGLGTAGLTAFACWRASREYGPALLAALRAGRPQVFATPGEESVFGRPAEVAAVAAAVAGAMDPDAHIRRVAVEILGDLPAAEGPAVLRRAAVADADPTVRAVALQSLARAGLTSGRDSAAAALSDVDATVRLAAVHAIDVLDGTGVAHAVRAALADPDRDVRVAAAAAVLRRAPHDSEAACLVRGLLDDPDAGARSTALRALAAAGAPSMYDLGARHLGDPSPAVRAAAVQAAAACDPVRAVGPLIEALGDNHDGVREAAAAALATIAPGPPVVDALGDPTRAAGALRALELSAVPPPQELLRAYAAAESARAAADLDLIRRVPSAGAAARLLRDSLLDRARANASHALRAIALTGDGDAIRFALDNLDGKEPSQVATALEALDSIGDAAIVRPLLPLWEPLASGGPARDDWPTALLTDPDLWIRECAALAATPPSQGSALELAITTLSDMERVLFLRNVPLFADLSPQDLRRVADIAREQCYVEGEVVAGQGEAGDELHIVVDGEVRVLRRESAAGPDVELARRSRGDVVGEMALITRQPRIASVVAAGDVRTLRVGRAAFEGVLRERPETAIAVIHILSARLAERSHDAGTP